jgi:formylglycine-generating enzyme required for sulfatase activity
MPAQAQLKRIVGDKPITVLLAQMFIDDVITNREEGLLAGSVTELMLSYVRRLDTPADPTLRRRSGLVIDEALVQRALRVIALRSHRQGPERKPLFQPLEFSEALARQALMANKPEGLALTDEQSTAVLGYLIELRLLLQPGAAVGRLRFPLDPLADHLAAAEQFERLEEQALAVPEQSPAVWEAFLAALEPRPEAERKRMRGFLLALRDGAMEAQGKRALAMPAEVPDRLAALGFLDAEGERYRLAYQRALKWVWELAEPEEADRLHAIRRLREMSLPIAPDCQQRAARTISPKFLARLAADPTKSDLERTKAVKALGNMTADSTVDQLERLVIDEDLPLAAINAAIDILNLRTLARLSGKIDSSARWKRVMEEMHGRLKGEPLNMLVSSEDDWSALDRALIRLQAGSRVVRKCATSEAIPLTGGVSGLSMPMLTLSARKEENGWRICTEIVHPAVWMVPLLAGQRLEVVRIPDGRYKVGPSVYPGLTQSADGAIPGEDSNAIREVEVESHYFSRYAITHAQWEAVARLPRVYLPLAVKPWTFERKHSLSLGDPFSRQDCNNLPVDSVSWWDCQEWLARLNTWLDEQWVRHGGEGLAPELTLPSPDLWEIACRAGSSTAFHFGDILDPGWSLYHGSGGVGSPRAGINRVGPLPIGYIGLVNQWGLAEMHGQLFELCEREGGKTSRSGIIPGDPITGCSANPDFISVNICGGSWAAEARECVSSYRATISSNRQDANVGFRPCFKA